MHAKARPDETTPPPAPPTGIDYLQLVEAQHTAELAQRVQYSLLQQQCSDGQLHIPERNDETGAAGEGSA